MNVMTAPNARELVIVRQFNAPRERVFAAWIDPKQAQHWWVPRDFVPLSCTMDVRVGGAWHRRMRSPTGGQGPARQHADSVAPHGRTHDDRSDPGSS